MPPKLPALPPLSSIQPAAYLRLLALATAGGVATLFGIGLAIEPQGLADDPGPFQITLPATASGTTVAFRTAGMQSLGHDPVHLRSVRLDTVPAGLGHPSVLTQRVQGEAMPGVTTDAQGTAVTATTIRAGQTWALVVSVPVTAAGRYHLPGLTVAYDVAGHHKTRHYAMDVDLTATS